MTKTIKSEIVWADDCRDRFVSLTYVDGTKENFEIIRGSIAWPHEGIPGLILIGGILLGEDRIKVLEEAPFGTLPEARSILDNHSALYEEALYTVYYQNSTESEGFKKYLTGIDKNGKAPLKAAPFTESISYSIQLVNSSLTADKVLVPGDGTLAAQLASGRNSVSSEKDLSGVIALSCLISGIEARFDGLFSEAHLEKMPAYPRNCRPSIKNIPNKNPLKSADF